MTRINLFFAFVLLTSLLVTVSPAQGYDWYLGFEAGPCVPVEAFDEYLDDEMTYGVSVDYIPREHLGVRIAYNHHEFQYDHYSDVASPLEIDSIGVWAVIDYKLPRYFRFYGLVGPTYYYTRHDDYIPWGDDSKDIGWSGGGGFEFSPFVGWGFRFQALYNSGELGDGDPRASWVNTTFGMSFKF